MGIHSGCMKTSEGGGRDDWQMRKECWTAEMSLGNHHKDWIRPESATFPEPEWGGADSDEEQGMYMETVCLQRFLISWKEKNSNYAMEKVDTPQPGVPGIHLLPLSSELPWPCPSLSHWRGDTANSFILCQPDPQWALKGPTRLEEEDGLFLLSPLVWHGSQQHSPPWQLSAPVARRGVPPVSWFSSTGQAAYPRQPQPPLGGLSPLANLLWVSKFLLCVLFP